MEMDALVCRICLVTNVKMYSLQTDPLKSCAETIAVLTNYLSDCNWQFPQNVCYECAAILLKFSKFVQKCLKAKSVLLGLSTVYQDKISEDIVMGVNRKAMKLESNLCYHHNPPNTYNVILAHIDKDFKSKTINLSKNSIKLQGEIHIDIKQDPITEEINYDNNTVNSDFGMKTESNVDLEIENSFEECLEMIVKPESNISAPDDAVSIKNKAADNGCSSNDENNSIFYHNEESCTAGTPNLTKIFDEDFSNTKVYVDVPDIIKNSSKKRKKSKTKRSKLKVAKVKTAAAKKQKNTSEKDSEKAHLRAGEGEVAKRNALFKERISKCFDIVDLSHEEQVKNLEKRKESSLYSSAPFKCHLCFKFFQRSQSYNKHMEEHEPKRGSGFTCPVCKKWVRGKQLFSRHILAAHSRTFVCKLCQYTCLERNLRIHMNSHEEYRIPYQCALCDFVADIREAKMSAKNDVKCEGNDMDHVCLGVWLEYRRHRRHAHSPSLDCRRCGRAFISERGLQIHNAKMHDADELTSDMDLYTHSCKDCDVTFASEEALKLHLKTSSKHGGVKFDSIIQSEVRKRQISQIFPRKCDYCPALANTARELWRHVNAAHKAHRKAYRSLIAHHMCHVCGQSFDSITRLRNHTVQHDEKATASLPCPVTSCTRVCHDKYQLNLHVKAAHGGYRPHQCSQCDLAFKQRATLDRHMLVHSGARPFKCTFCDKSFTQSGSRNLHVRTVHEGSPHPYRDRRKKKLLLAETNKDAPQ